MTRSLIALASLVVAVAPPARTSPGQDLLELARRVASDGTAESVAELRAAGAGGLEAFLEANAERLAACGQGTGTGCERLLEALDRVAGQRGALHSRLFWYTDLAAAEAAARASGRPILSLHLLGRLDEDFSCANSRFFRTVLYADAAVSQVLRDRFILHWASVRSAPRVTVDFGDGRRLERTLTGNSIHYVLTPDARPVDALPGLYAPRAFLAALDRAEAVARDVWRAPRAQAERSLRAYHREARSRLAAERARDLAMLGAQEEPAGAGAARADSLAVTKSALQRPLLADVIGSDAAPPVEDRAWHALGLRHLDSARLSDSSRRLVAGEAPDGERAVRRLEERLAEDTARNELDLHARLHGWFADGSTPADLEGLNARVYRELFLAADDPWAGLAPDDLFVGLPNGGRVAR